MNEAYYKSQLKKLQNTGYLKSVKFFDGDGGETKQMGINWESLPIFIEWLQKEQQDALKIMREALGK